MKKKILLSCLLSFGVLSFSVANTQNVKEIYVSKTNGNDNNSGSESAPLKTVEVAIFGLQKNTPTIIYLEGNVTFDIEAPLNMDTDKTVELIGDNTTLRASEQTPFEGGEGSRILRAASGCNLKVSGITFENGRQVEYILGGGIYFAGETMEIDNCRFLNNQAGSAGAAIGARGKQVIIKNSYFEGNNLDGGGGYGAAIMQAGQKTTLEPCSLVVQNCTFYKNFMPNGGQGTAISVYDPSVSSAGGGYVNLSYLEVSNCTFVENTTADGYQAAIDLSHSAASVQDCYIINNTFYKNDGAFRFYYNEKPYYFINNVVYANKAAILNEMTVAQGREPLFGYNNILIGEERGVNESIDDESFSTAKASEYNNIVKTAAQYPVANLGLSSSLSKEEGGSVPYLKITSSMSSLVDAGIDNSTGIIGKNFVPELDIRGCGTNNKKDIGAFEYGGIFSSIVSETAENLFYSMSVSGNAVIINNLDNNDINVKVITIDGRIVYNENIKDEAVIGADKIGKGVVIFSLSNGTATKSFKMIF